jgi:hypothetical protein
MLLKLTEELRSQPEEYIEIFRGLASLF